MKFHPGFLVPTGLLALTTFAFAHENEEHKLLATDGVAGDNLGQSVAMHEEDAVAGAPGVDALGVDSGAAYVFSHDGTDFVQQAKLLPSDGLAGDAFGNAVAISHDTVVVGASGSDSNGAGSGAAYVFVRTGTVWTQEAKLLPIPAAAGDAFGASVAVHEDTVLIGATGAQAAFVFVRTGTVWTQEARLTGSGASASNQFGVAVSLEEDLAVVGAPKQNGVQATTGAVYVFSRTGVIWSQDQKLQAADGDTDDMFGAAVALGGKNWLVIGAPRDDDAGIDAGASYQWPRQGGVWVQGAKRLGPTAQDWMGSSVGVSFNYSVAGARRYDYLNQPLTGGVVLWNFAQPTSVEVFVASDESVGARLGTSVAMDLCNIVAGSPGDDELGLDAGAAYIFATLEGSAVLVNGSGVNPVVMTTEEAPNIGADWHVEFDTTAFPTVDQTILYVYRRFAAVPTTMPLGEMLLDLSSQRILARVESGSGIVAHEIPVPNDTALVGIQAAVQGFLRNSTTGDVVAFTNGELVTLGCHGSNHP